MSGWALGERSGLSCGPACIADNLALVRRRFVAYLEGLDEQGWGEPTRCAAWTVHQVARHLVDTSRIDAARLAGRPPVYSLDAPFDPTRTPDLWLQSSAGQSPSETLVALTAAVDDEVESFRVRIRDGGPALDIGPSGRRTHWSNVALHMLWDGWLHERDVLVPRGVEQPSADDELRLVAMYGLQVAAIPPLLVDRPLETTVALRGAPDRRYRVSTGDGQVTVTAEEDGEAALAGGLASVVDALAGRGQAVAAVLDGDAADVDALSWLSALMCAEPA